MTFRAGLRAKDQAVARGLHAPGNSRRFWNAALLSIAVWLAALLVYSIITSAFSAVTLAALIAAGAAAILALLGRFGDYIQGATPFKLVFLGQAAYAVIVLGSVQFVGPMGIPFRLPIIDDNLVRAAGLHSLFVVTLGYAARIPHMHAGPVRALAQTSTRTAHVGWSAVAIGTLALYLRFDTPGDLIAYWSGAPVPQPNSWILLFSNLFRPLLPVGLFLLVASRRVRKRGKLWLPWVIVAVLTVLVLGTYSFNRAAIVTPFIALLLISGLAGRQLRWFRVLLAGAGLVFAAVISGVLRSTLFNYGRADLDVASWSETIWTQIQLYGQSPHFTAEVVQNPHGYSLRSLVASFVSPIPGIPDSLRSSSSTSIYNESIYGRLPVQDQIIPTWAELWAVGDLPLLLMAGLFMGWTLRMLTVRATGSSNYLTQYGYALAATWLSVSPFYSFSAIVQSILYFVLPVLFVGTLFAGTRQQLRPADDSRRD